MLIASLKPRTMGGTTNTGLLAYALARAGHPVTCYDADESLQLSAWARDAGDFPCQVHVADTPAFAEVVYPEMDHERVNVVDAGHAENHPDIVDSILEVVDLVILTLSSGPSGPQPSADLVALSHFRVALLPVHVRAELAEARRALAGRRPDEGNFGTALADKICSIAFLGSVAKPEPRERGADFTWVQQVDGHLRTFVFQAKCAPYGAERERARLGVFAALNARRAILQTRTVDGWKPAVAEFASMWLGIPNPDTEWLEAVSTALLGSWVDLLDEHLLDDAGALGLKQLKRESSVVHRQLKPLWRRKTAGGRLLSLDHPVPGGCTLVDVLADRAAHDEPSVLWEPDADAAACVFSQLSPDEQQVARAWAQSGRASWTEAADLVGVTAHDADNVRRKLRRLGRCFEERTAAARVTRGSLTGIAGSGA